MILPLLALTGCVPAHIVVPAPDYDVRQPEGDAVSVSFPVDVRPSEERRDGGFYTSSLPLPFVSHGDANLEPSSLGAVARATEGALMERGVPEQDDSAYDVRLYVLHHAGTRDVSDAQWTSTLTGGLAGTVGKFVYPAFFVAYSTVRVEVEGPAGTTVRDVTAYATHRRSVARTWGWPSLFRKAPAKQAMTDVLSEMHTDLGRQIATVIDENRSGEVSGEAPTVPAQHSLHRWSQADSFTARGKEPAWVAAKYPSERFSLVTGHDTTKGEVVGRIALPLDTLGYDVGIFDRWQWQLDVTVLGLVNQAGTGLRTQVGRVGDFAFSMEASAGLTVALPPSESYRPSLAALNARGTGMISWRPGEVTWFARAGWSAISVRHELEEIPDLELGGAIAITASPGLEVQLSTTTLLALQVRTSATFQNGNPLALGRLGAVQVVPQFALGLR
ncbi:MAG: hypothetical protein KC912_02965 [Proteobacteria bacterium]|nr:hypothetical protein [Pseudomonadota bacterium]